MKTLVLGLGNPVLTDDGVGLRVVRELRSRLAVEPDVELDEDYHGGLRLMERMIGFDRAIVVDAMRLGLPAGTVRCMHAGQLTTQHSASAHDANLATALALGRSAGAHLPAEGEILIVGIEAADVRTFGEACTPRVEEAIPDAVSAVLLALTA